MQVNIDGRFLASLTNFPPDKIVVTETCVKVWEMLKNCKNICVEGPKGTGKSCTLLYIRKMLCDNKRTYLMTGPNFNIIALKYYESKENELEGDDL